MVADLAASAAMDAEGNIFSSLTFFSLFCKIFSEKTYIFPRKSAPCISFYVMKYDSVCVFDFPNNYFQFFCIFFLVNYIDFL